MTPTAWDGSWMGCEIWSVLRCVTKGRKGSWLSEPVLDGVYTAIATGYHNAELGFKLARDRHECHRAVEGYGTLGTQRGADSPWQTVLGQHAKVGRVEDEQLARLCGNDHACDVVKVDAGLRDRERH